MTKRERAIVTAYDKGMLVKAIITKYTTCTNTILRLIDLAGSPRRYKARATGGKGIANACKEFLKAVIARTEIRNGKRWRVYPTP